MNADQYDDVFRIRLLEGARFEGRYGFPVIERTNSVPEVLLPFDKTRQSKGDDGFVHFFLGDRSFMRLWNNPFRYLPILARQRGAIAPDFSIMWTHPPYVQIESIGRSRMIGSWLQRAGVDTIPVARWGLPETYSFAFDAIAPGGTVAVGTTGCTQNPEARSYFAEGISELLLRVEPKTLVVYGPLREDVFAPVFETGVRVVHFESDTTIKKRGIA